MTDVAASRKNIQIEETQHRGAVSESLGQKLGGSINLINDRQYDTKPYFLNGPYSIIGATNAVDGLYIPAFDLEIFDVAMFNITAGSGGTTELDVKKATTPGGAFSTIFSTTPKVTSSAAASTWVRVGDTVTGWTAPILTTSPFNVDAGDALRLDLISAMTGGPENCGLILYYRPR